MKKLVRIALPFFTFASLFINCLTTQAQSLTLANTESPVHILDAKMSTRLMKDLSVEVDLRWRLPTNQVFVMTVFANETNEVYGIKILGPKGLTAFARGKEIIEWFESKGNKVKIKGKINFDRPFILQRKINQYIVSQFETEYVDKVFLVANDMLIKKGVPDFSRVATKEALTDKRLSKNTWK